MIAGRLRARASRAALGAVLIPALAGIAATPATGVAAGAAAVVRPAAASSGDSSAGMLALHLTGFSPQVLRAGQTSLTVSGTVRNVSDRDLSGVAIRLQAGPRLASSQAVVRALRGAVAADRAASPFTTVAAKLAPGERAHFSERIPRGALGLAAPGVYPLLVNVNGRPAYSGRARLASVSMLLPVRATPATSGPSASPGAAQGAPGTGVSMLWPLVDEHPRIVGSSGGKPVLSDDGLATSLRPGGRLYGLVDALDRAGAAHPALLRGTCFAIDPELLAAVRGMTGGYLVAAGGKTRPGDGRSAAVSWLSRLRELTDNRCVIPLPYADADLVSLSDAGLADLANRSLKTGIVADTLPGARVVSTVRWPAGGYVDQQTRTGTAYRGATVLAASSAWPDSSTATGGAHPVAHAAGVSAVRIDGLVHRGLLGRPERGTLPAGARTPADEPAVATQNGIATLLFRAAHSGPAGVLIAPPRRWHAPEPELQRFLATLARLEGRQLLAARPITDLVAGDTSAAPVDLDYPQVAAEREIGARAMHIVAQQDARLTDIASTMKPDPSASVPPSDVVNPFYRALMAATSSAHRGRGPAAGAEARNAAATARARLADLVSEISLSNTAQTISLTSKNSPLPVSIDNDLPVRVTVRVHLFTPAIQPHGKLLERVPPHSSRTFYLPTEVVRSGRFTVKAALTTPEGTPLGEPARLEVSSGAYGSIILVVTGVAFAVLILLVGRRVYSRVRSARRGASRATNDTRSESAREQAGR